MSSFEDRVAQVVAAYVAKNETPLSDIPKVIEKVRQALRAGAVEEIPLPDKPPAVEISKSVTPDYIICLEDGAKLKLLRRHLKAKYGMTPEQYRKRWGLDPAYPMTAPNYSTRRKEIAVLSGLGQ